MAERAVTATRRAFLTAAAAGLATLGAVSVAAPVYVGGLRKIRGKNLYVEILGEERAPALLYLHGGPGTGSYDFARHQGARLSKYFRLILLDQRGVLRSDPLAPEEPFGLADLVEDAEALRLDLGVRTWSLLAHSFGGIIAVRYALAYPERVDRLIFENPTFDLETSARSLLLAAAAEYGLIGDAGGAARARAAAAAPGPPAEIWERFTELTNALGGRRMNLYVHGPEKNFFAELVNASGLGEEWGRGAAHQRRLYDEGLVFQPLTGRLAKIARPALLIKGRYDAVTAPIQIEAFRTIPGALVSTFESSSHFARFEEAGRFAEVVSDFAAGRRD